MHTCALPAPTQARLPRSMSTPRLNLLDKTPKQVVRRILSPLHLLPAIPRREENPLSASNSQLPSEVSHLGKLGSAGPAVLCDLGDGLVFPLSITSSLGGAIGGHALEAELVVFARYAGVLEGGCAGAAGVVKGLAEALGNGAVSRAAGGEVG